MKCDVCRENPAIIFVQQVSRGSSIELHLCEKCARSRGFSTGENKIEVSLGGLFSDVLDGAVNLTGGDISKANSCPVCSLTFQDIKKHHKAGCSECYRHFRAEIVSLLRLEGIEIAYTGELPENSEPSQNAVMDSAKLKKELQDAIEHENYEMAAYYRDRLRSIGGAK